MKIDKTKLKMGIWYEDKDGNYIPTNNEIAAAPDNAETCHVSFPLEVREEIYAIHEYGGRRTYRGSDRIMTGCVHIGVGNEDVILAMANSGDYTLGEAIIVYASCCERCANVLTYKYLNGKDGYSEYSDDWKNCNTICDFCREDAESMKLDIEELKRLEIEMEENEVMMKEIQLTTEHEDAGDRV